MPFPVPFLPVMLIAVIGGGILIGIFKLFPSDASREAHTHFAIRQVTERLDDLDDGSFPTTAAGLMSCLRSSQLDWNNCGIQGDQILDGWGKPIAFAYDRKAGIWSFHSFGKDGKSGTADDIGAATLRNRAGGIADGP